MQYTTREVAQSCFHEHLLQFRSTFEDVSGRFQLPSQDVRGLSPVRLHTALCNLALEKITKNGDCFLPRQKPRRFFAGESEKALYELYQLALTKDLDSNAFRKVSQVLQRCAFGRYSNCRGITEGKLDGPFGAKTWQSIFLVMYYSDLTKECSASPRALQSRQLAALGFCIAWMLESSAKLCRLSQADVEELNDGPVLYEWTRRYMAELCFNFQLIFSMWDRQAGMENLHTDVGLNEILRSARKRALARQALLNLTNYLKEVTPSG